MILFKKNFQRLNRKQNKDLHFQKYFNQILKLIKVK